MAPEKAKHFKYALLFYARSDINGWALRNALRDLSTNTTAFDVLIDALVDEVESRSEYLARIKKDFGYGEDEVIKILQEFGDFDSYEKAYPVIKAFDFTHVDDLIHGDDDADEDSGTAPRGIESNE